MNGNRSSIAMEKNKNGIFFDFSVFNKDFERIVENAIPKAAERGLFIGASALLLDADEEIPKTPKDKGDLRGSKLIEKPVIEPGNISISAGFNIEYAAAVHEKEKTKSGAAINWKFPGSGPKFLESKMAKNKDKYMKLAADYMLANQR